MSKNYVIRIQFVFPLTTFCRSGAQRSDVYKRDVFVTSWRFHNRATSRPPVRDIRDTVNPLRGPDQSAMFTSYRVWDYIPTTMMMPSSVNIFLVTGPFCGEFTVHRWIPLTKASDAELWCLIYAFNKGLSGQSWGWRFETPSCPLWRHRNVNQRSGDSVDNVVDHPCARNMDILKLI